MHPNNLSRYLVKTRSDVSSYLNVIKILYFLNYLRKTPLTYAEFNIAKPGFGCDTQPSSIYIYIKAIQAARVPLIVQLRNFVSHSLLIFNSNVLVIKILRATSESIFESLASK